ncbi:MAG: Bug family tripartite tricarboxylate transporter substrate binding protein [Pigmentiphaga sp.]
MTPFFTVLGSSIRHAIAIGTFTLITPLASASVPADFPSRPVSVIVPYGAGGAGDTLGRAIAVQLEKQLGQSFVVENRPGATGNIGMAAGARAAPDGYTLTLVASNLATNPLVYSSMSFDPLKDLVPVTEVAKFASVLVVNPSVKVDSVQDLVDEAKKSPDALFFGTAGLGSSGHLALGLLSQAAGIELENVPYQGEAPAVAGVLANDVPMAFATLSTVLPHVAAGKLKAIGTTAGERSAVMPDVPTIGETLSDYESTGWFGVVLPRGTDPDIVSFYAREVKKALESEEVSARLTRLNLEPSPSNPAEFTAFIDSEVEKYRSVIKEMNLKLD